MDMRKASTAATFSKMSIVSLHGKGDVWKPERWRGPGIGSPWMLQTLCPSGQRVCAVCLSRYLVGRYAVPG